jgi:hypothetical protein
MISELTFLTPNLDHEAYFIVAIDASKVDIVGVLLQEDAIRSLRS